MKKSSKIGISLDLSHPNITTLRKELSQLPINIMRERFSLLTPELKAALWKNRIYEVLNNNLFNNSQVILIEQALRKITPEIYIKDSIQYERFSVFAKKWEKLALLVFIKEFLIKTFNMLDDDNYNTQKQNVSGGSGSDCECSTTSDWCFFGDCKKGGCLITGGCGFIGWYDCDGMCIVNSSPSGVYVSAI